ncbi:MULTISPECIES: YfhO family protein [unclassified Nitrospina]|uniref:YfhO family protein n=1 Tax=unclassified Nitrospina TaxID=2638683 RepID=UPI003F94B99F
MLSIIIAVSLILVLALLPIYAWPLTRPFALPALGCYILFLFIHHDFVLGNSGVYHDSFWSTELFATILRQWLESGNEFGWNPYIGGGQPIAVFNNLLNVFPTFFCHYLFGLFGLDLSSREFFNLVFVFTFLNVCTGSLLLIRLLNPNFYICLLGFGSMVFGGMFQSELGCPLGLMYLTFLPYLLFFLIHFYKTRRVENVVFFFVLLGMSAAYYIPLYHSIAIGTFLILASLACLFGIWPDYRKQFLIAARAFLGQPKAIALGVVLFILAAGSAFYSYAETRDYVSPTRGFTQGGKLGERSYIPSVSVLPEHYKKIVDFFEDRPENVYTATHNTFYLGVLPGLGFLASFFLIRNHLFTGLAAVLAVLSLGEQTPAWRWMVANVPVLDMLRNPFPFGRLATFCILMGGLLGLSALLDQKVSFKRKMSAIIAASLLLVYFSSISLTVFLFLSVLLLLLISLLVQYRKPDFINMCGSWLLLITIVQLGGFSINTLAYTKFPEVEPQKIKKFSYPMAWSVYPSRESPMPFNLYPFLNKEAAWSVHHPAYAFYLQKDFAGFLLRENLFPVNAEDLSQKYLIDEDDLNHHAGPLFQLLPKGRDWRISSNAESPHKSGEVTPYPSANVSELKVQVDMREEGALWRLENYDPNWKAWVDGKETPIEKVPPNFQAIPLEPGRHEILFKYDSPYHFLLYGHILIGVVGMACFIVWLRKPDYFKGLCRL